MVTRTPPLSEGRAAVPLWRNVSFQLMWSSVAASGFGDRIIQLVAWSMLGVQVAGSDAASIQAGVAFFFFLPYVVMGLPAGWLADTLPRKWLMLFCDEARAAVLLLAYLMAPAGTAGAIPGDHYWKVYAIIAAVGTMAAVFSPTKAATIPQIVATRQLQPANAVVLGIAVIASLIGFAVGGPIIERVSIRAGLVVAILCYAISGTFFAFMRLKPHHRASLGDRPSQIQRVAQAVGYVRTHRPILEMMGLSVLFWTAATVLMASIAAMCKTRYGLTHSEVLSHTATMMATVGAGMLLSSLWVAWMNSRRESAWFAMIALLAAGLHMAAMAMNPSYGLGLALVLGTGFWGNTAMICVTTLTQSIAPDYIRGRVFGVRDLVDTLSAVIVNLVIWRLPNADQYMVATLMVVSGVLVLAAGWGLWVQITAGPFPKRGMNAAWRVCRAYMLVWHRLRWIGRENIPTRGKVILASNHTTGLDPLVIQAAAPRVVRWVMLRSYMFPLLKPLWRIIEPIAVDQDGSDLSQLKQMIRVLNDDQVLGIFPEGGAQREHRKLQPFEPGIGLLARRSGAVIVPVWIYGTPQARNMIWHFLCPSRSAVTFGPPIEPSPDMSNEAIAGKVREALLRLSDPLKYLD